MVARPFIVTKKGVYLQDVHGPFATQDEAESAARGFAAKDDDGYHSWEVHPLSLEGIEVADPVSAFAQEQYCAYERHRREVVRVPKGAV